MTKSKCPQCSKPGTLFAATTKGEHGYTLTFGCRSNPSHPLWTTPGTRADMEALGLDP